MRLLALLAACFILAPSTESISYLFACDTARIAVWGAELEPVDIKRLEEAAFSLKPCKVLYLSQCSTKLTSGEKENSQLDCGEPMIVLRAK